MALTNLGKAVLGAAFLFLLACGGGDSFKANPNAVVDSSQLGDMIAAATQPEGLTQVTSQPLPMPGDNVPSCNEQGMACSPGGGTPGLAVVYKGSDGSNAIVEVLIEPEAQDAVRALTSRSEDVTILSVATLKVLSSGVSGSGLIGPCDPRAAFNAENACAYSKYTAPHSGDHALAYASDVVAGHGYASVFFARDFLVGRVEVTGADLKTAKSEANKLAVALDAQMKQALSR